ncbi:uncharacterized protein LOC126590371 [Malus sylvestris]|uniref:uncharacterized protein LOC126590371 n=1 Tax=Malus sylvestris TaxID=3752 RepID=UPI0021AC5555|nr:uncharacterized protein LOC126590371 [Malus sylvestris]
MASTAEEEGDLSDGEGQSNVGDGVSVGVVVRGVVTPTDTANHKLAAQGFLKLRIAALIFKAAYQFMEAKGSWEMNEVNRTEEAIPTRYYCYRCRHVVTVDVEMKCPFWQGGFIQACEGVASLYVAMASESGSDVESTIHNSPLTNFPCLSS